MNTLQGTISSVQTDGQLSLVKVSINNSLWSAIVIDTPQTLPHLQKDAPVKLVFKETEVIIGKDHPGNISLQNQVTGTVTALDKQPLLCKVSMHTECGNMVSVITTNAANQLNLTEGAEITAMVKTNEIMIEPC